VQILSTIAASMVSLTALVLTITMVVVQLAMGQFSPRIVQRILRDKPSQVAIGVFVATFAHAMLAMREVAFEPTIKVPGVAIVVAYLLVFVSIVVLVMYVHHIGQSLRVSALIELVGNDTRRLLDRRYPDEGTVPPTDAARVVRAPSSGVVTRVSFDHLVDVAAQADCVLEVVPGLGEFVPAGAPLCRVHGLASEEQLADDDVVQSIALGPERTLDQDVAYGMRLLVDIAERSISDSPSSTRPPRCKRSTGCTTVCDSSCGDRCRTGCTMMQTASYGSSCARWIGTPTCTWRSTRSGKQARARRRSRAVWKPHCTIFSPLHPTTGAPHSNCSSSSSNDPSSTRASTRARRRSRSSPIPKASATTPERGRVRRADPNTIVVDRWSPDARPGQDGDR
jgi:hypothetical protein